MSWTIETTSPDGRDWTSLLNSCHHLVFHEPIWSDVVKEGVSSRTVCILFRENGEIRSGAIGFLLGALGINIAYFNFPYGSVVGTPPPTDELVRLLQSFSAEYNICQIQFVGFPDAPRIEGDQIQLSDDSTHVLDLQGVTSEVLWTSYRRSRRQDIKKTRERGISIVESNKIEDVDLLHHFYLQTMRRTGGLARYKKGLLKAIARQLVPERRARIYFAMKSERYIAGMLLVDSKTMSHGLLLACSDDGLKEQPNKLMLHTAAESCCERGLSALDYMPSGQSASGVTNFKNLWGAEQVPILHATMTTKSLKSLLWRTAFGVAKREPARSII
ncbi:MAG: GNAT family N-acetyltransferase, partial [Planctomycetota bacterium]